MEGNISACPRHVLAMGEGFGNDPSDHGGATNWGITAAMPSLQSPARSSCCALYREGFERRSFSRRRASQSI